MRIDGNALKCSLECRHNLGVRVGGLEGVQIQSGTAAVHKCRKHSLRGTSDEDDIACSGDTVLS